MDEIGVEEVFVDVDKSEVFDFLNEVVESEGVLEEVSDLGEFLDCALIH